MPEELLPADVEQYTKGRLLASDPETARGLDAAIAKARRYCGWHVAPVLTETITLDGDGGRLLFLPTLKIVSIDSITIDDVVVDPDTYKTMSGAPGVVAKTHTGGCHWNFWHCGVSNIEVTFTHGFTAAEAADWRDAVLRLIDQASLTVGQVASGPMTEKKVDVVQYRWSDRIDYTGIDRTALAQYKLFAL